MSNLGLSKTEQVVSKRVTDTTAKTWTRPHKTFDWAACGPGWTYCSWFRFGA